MLSYNGKFWRRFILAKSSETAIFLNWRIKYLAINFVAELYDVAITHAQWTKNWRFLIWQLTSQSPNCQIKTTAKISRYMVINEFHN